MCVYMYIHAIVHSPPSVTSHTRASSQATGSILVLPPIQRLYLLKQPSDKVTRIETPLWLPLSRPSAPPLLGVL